jgi:hypothetical protein
VFLSAIRHSKPLSSYQQDPDTQPDTTVELR